VKLSLISAFSKNRVIGKEGGLPWRLPFDMSLFKKITTGHHILMGYGNYLSLGKPLPNRTNIVLTHKNISIDGFIVVNSVEDALHIARQNNESEFFFIGGESIFRLALPLVDYMYITIIDAEMEGDRFFPPFSLSDWNILSKIYYPADTSNPYNLTFLILRRR